MRGNGSLRTSQPGRYAGKSIREMLEHELDACIVLLMDEEAPTNPDGEERRDPAPSRLRLQGKADGIALCLATFTNPYTVDIAAIKDAAMERYYEAHPEAIEEEEEAVEEEVLQAE